jgi:lipid A 3-O-deacylase
MDMHFQFEDRAGIGVRWGEQQAYETIFTAYHYSNASLGKHNSGLNLVMLSFGKRFN